MLKKINISQIIRNHFATLQNANTKKAEFDDYLTFFIIPVAVSSTLLYFKFYLKTDAINIIISTLSILVGLLFNVVVLIFDIIKRDKSNQIKNTVLRQILSNIAYTILLSIVAIIMTLFTYIDNYVTQIIFNAIVYFLLTNFVMTVLMILKRMFHLFHKEIEDEIEE